MTRNLKVLGLAIVAVFAMSAVAASAASAALFEAESAPVNLSGKATANQIFTYETGGSAVECTNATFKGTQTATSTSEVEVHPEYTGCTVPAVGGTATVTTTGCNYLFTIEPTSTSGPVHVKCGTGSITITVSVPLLGDICTFHIGSQTPGGVADYSNENSGTARSVIVQPTQTGITATRTGSSLCGAASSTTGTYTGKGTVEGRNPTTNAQVGVFVS